MKQYVVQGEQPHCHVLGYVQALSNKSAQAAARKYTGRRVTVTVFSRAWHGHIIAALDAGNLAPGCGKLEPPEDWNDVSNRMRGIQKKDAPKRISRRY